MLLALLLPKALTIVLLNNKGGLGDEPTKSSLKKVSMSRANKRIYPTRPDCKICGRPVGDSFQRGRLYYRAICERCKVMLWRMGVKYKELANIGDLLKCSHCGWIGFCDVHHKDGNRENKDPNNREILCPNCHRNIHQPLTDTLIKSIREGSFSPLS